MALYVIFVVVFNVASCVYPTILVLPPFPACPRHAGRMACSFSGRTRYVTHTLLESLVFFFCESDVYLDHTHVVFFSKPAGSKLVFTFVFESLEYIKHAALLLFAT